MNIFKILGSGDGRLHEPNVSAFLGYLLNPKAEHGLSDELLKKILFSLYQKNKESSLKEFLIDKYENPRDLSIRSKFEIEVLPEQAFKQDDTGTNQIVDIVILCFEKKNEKNQSLAKAILSNNRADDLKQIFLIENKIKDEATTENQLNNQVKSTIDTLTKLLSKSEDEIENILSLIFISPVGERSSEEYSNLQRSETPRIPSVHIYWNLTEDEDPTLGRNEMTVIDFLKNILQEEAQGNIEAINEYTKHTLKSFINFIENNFKSTIDEELEGKNERKDRVEKDIYFMHIRELNEDISDQLLKVHEQLISLEIPSFPKFTRKKKRLSYYLNEKSKMFFHMDTNIGTNTLEVNYLRNEKSKDTDVRHVNTGGKIWFERSLSFNKLNIDEIINLYKDSYSYLQNKHM